MPIDEIAECTGIYLKRDSGPSATGGFAHFLRHRDDENIVRYVPVIMINTQHRTEHGEPVGEREIFFHEFYHLLHSSVENDFLLSGEESLITLRAMHAQEERRAQDFAARMLIDEIRAGETAREIAWRCDVSTRLAEHACRAASAHDNVTRDWRAILT